MKFKKNSQIDNVKRFCVNEHGLFYLTNDLQIPRIQELDLVDAGFRKEGTIIRLGGDILVVEDGYGNELFYDVVNSALVNPHVDEKTHGRKIGGTNAPGTRHLLFVESVDGDYKYYVYDVDSGVFTELSGGFDVSLDSGQILLRTSSTQRTFIARVNQKGEELWKHNLEGSTNRGSKEDEEANELSRIIGYFEEVIWISTRANELYGLNAETGEKVFSSFDVGKADRYSIDKKGNRLVSLDGDYLRAVYLSNDDHELSKIEMKASFDSLGCEPDYKGRQFPIANTHVLFCDIFKSVVGAVRIDDGKVDWVFDLYETRDYATISDFELFADKLYVFCHNGSLHIFEREC